MRRVNRTWKQVRSFRSSRMATVVLLLGAVVTHTGAYAVIAQSSARSVTAAAAIINRNSDTRRSFEDAKLGLFFHWGIYSVLGKGERAMDQDKVPISEYAKLLPRFNPTRFDAIAWVKFARSAGAKYITITAKHHDGFCLFASRLTDYDVADRTPYHADPLKALADACHQEKIPLFFYYSLLDWHHPDYFPLGKTGHFAGRADKGDFKRYVDYYQGQIRELCTNYGSIGGIWLDGGSDKPDAPWDMEGTFRLIHELQPGALVGQSHDAAPPLPGQDFQVIDQDQDPAGGLDAVAASKNLALETCLSINESWGYNARDTRFKSSDQIIHALLEAAGRGANLLVTIGPRPDGTISPEITGRLLDVGKWLDTFGKSVYGTRRGPIPPQAWGVSVARGPVEHPIEIFLHVFKLKETRSILFDSRFSWTPRLFGKPEPLKLTPRGTGLVLEAPHEPGMPLDTIIALTPRATSR